jgi:N6-L-threonylcarbamoyladenine synthase
VDHIYSHIYANFLFSRENVSIAPRGFPFVALVVSGGHTSLFQVDSFVDIRLLGATQDDACGEAFDKVAKILDLGYPGGPLIERLAKTNAKGRRIKFSCAMDKRPLDFSFSGIKTAVLYLVQKGKAGYRKADIAASFQETVIDALIQKSFYACQSRKIKRLVVGGGVAANNRLRERFLTESKQRGIECYFPPRALCTDNAAMVAGFGARLFKQGCRSDLYLGVDLN